MSITARSKGFHWLMYRTSETAHFSINSDGKARMEAERAEFLDPVRWKMGLSAWASIGTTLGGGVTILGVVAILGYRSTKIGRVCLNRTSRIYRTVSLRSTSRVGGAGNFVVGMAGNGVRGSMAEFRIQLLKISWSLEIVVSCSW